MRLLVVAADLGLEAGGGIRPGGVAAMGRLVARALADSAAVETLRVWSFLDEPRAVEAFVARLAPVRPGGTAIEGRGFRGNRAALATAAFLHGRGHDHVTYLLLGPARTAPALLTTPFSVWLLGIEAWRVLGGLSRWAATHASSVFSISAHTAVRAHEVNPWLRLADVVHLGTEPGEPSLPGVAPSRRAPRVLMVSRLDARERYKGHDETLDAWPAVTAAVPDAELVVVGGGDDLERLRGRAASLPGRAGERVRFVGAVTGDGLERLYRESRVFLLPSDGEGFGIVFVEAMRAGTPCVCAGGAPAEIVLDGVTGISAARRPDVLARALTELLTDDGRADRLGARGRERYLERFTYDAFRGRMEAALPRLRGSRGPTARTPPPLDPLGMTPA